jgi:hypothetical protein
MQGVVLVVWMCCRLHEDGGRLQLSEHEAEGNCAVFEVDGTHEQLRRRQLDEQRGKRRDWEASASK